MSTARWISYDMDLERPNAARIYDYLLGGFHNFGPDRMVAEKFLEIYPDARLGAQASRAFLRRLINFLIVQGMDQFLDLGSGLPALGNVHEVAQRANPAARVVYVDIDPVAVTHARTLLEDNPNATAIRADARWPEEILNHEEVKGLLDFSRPVAVTLLLILQAIPDDEEAYGAVRTLRDALVPGSTLAITHMTRDGAPPGILEQMERLSAATSTPGKQRSRAEILRFFGGFELFEPGLVYLPLWRPEEPDDVFLDEPERSLVFGGVGRKT